MSGGVIPNGPDGITPGPLQERTAITAGQGAGVSRLPDFDQPTAEALLKEIFVQGSASLGQVVEQIFSGLRQGVSFSLAIIESIAKKILGLPDDFVFFNVDHALATLKKVPLVSEIVEAITGEEDGDLDDLGTWFINLRNFLGSLNFLDPNFNLGNAASTFIELVLWPVNKLAKLIGGFIPGLNIPGLDASKIISGTFADDLLPGFLHLMGRLFGALTGLGGDGATQDDVGDAAAQQTEIIRRISVQVQQLTDRLNNGESGVIVVSDAFEYEGIPDPAKWDVVNWTGSGGTGIRADGDELLWASPTGGNTRGQRLFYKGPDAESTEDKFGSHIIIGSELLPYNGASPFVPSYQSVITRANADYDTFVEGRLWRDQGNNPLIRVYVWVGNVLVASLGDNPIELPQLPGVGASLAIDVDPADDYKYLLKINASTYAFDDLGHQSLFGALYRRRGLGMFAGTTAVPPFGTVGQSRAGRIAHWASENNPAA